MILSEIISVPNLGHSIFINKPSQLDQYEQGKTVNEAISIRGSLGASQTRELKERV